MEQAFMGIHQLLSVASAAKIQGLIVRVGLGVEQGCKAAISLPEFVQMMRKAGAEVM